MKYAVIFSAAVLGTVLAGSLAAQQIPFQLRVTVGNSGTTIQNGGGLVFSAPVGQTQSAVVTAVYTGAGQVSVTQQPTVFGSSTFTSSLATAPPLSLGPGSSFSLGIKFSPISGAGVTGQVSLTFSEAQTTSGVTTTTTNTITLALQGTAPSLVLSYLLQTDQNVVPLQAGGTLLFPPSPVNVAAQAALNVTNLGSGTGTVTGISITGSAFKLTRLPLFPSAIPAAQTLQVLVLYQPTAVATDTGQIQITFDSGPAVTIRLEGSGSSSTLVYQVLQDPPLTVPAGGTIPVPDTNVGQTNSALVRILNTGNAAGTISSINLTGQAFQLLNGPVLPLVLAPNASVTLTVAFSPTLPGTLTGRLIVNSDILNLSGIGLGPRLEFSYVANGTTITLGGANNSVVFSPVTISQSASLSFDVKNSGTLPATVSNIGLGQTSSPFALIGIPQLPVTLAPNANFKITITFAPSALGFSNGTLLIDTASVALVGSGTQPPALSSYTLTGPSGVTAPITQPNVTLTLASPYPVAVSGTLIISAAGSLPADPAVQFATGGATVAFVIPANATSAVFGAQGAQIGLQTGTVASSFTITPSFATRIGGVDLTPTAPKTLTFSVAPAAPVLISVQVAGQTTNGFTLSVTGFSTSRTLSNWTVDLAPTPGFSFPATKFALDIQQIAAAWFRSAASTPFGGQFTISVPFTFQGTPPTGQTLLNAIASVSVTMSNDLGTSNSLQAKVQ